MKGFFFLHVILFLILTDLSIAVENTVYGYEFREGVQTYIFGDNARIRKDPAIRKDNVIDSLAAGVQVTVVSRNDVYTAVDGYKAPWYRISYQKDKGISEGFIWGGLLAIGVVAERDKLILAGIKKYTPDKGFIAECRCVSGGKVISSVSFEPHYMPDGNNEGAYGYAVTTEVYGNRGLDGLENVIRINFSYGACGYPRGNVWIGYCRGRLYYIGRDTSVSEAGVFHVEERYIFPDGNVESKGRVKLVNESYDFDEDIKDYKLTERKEKRFIWENYKLNPEK